MATFDRILILETSTARGLVAVADAKGIVHSNALEQSRRRASDLTMVIKTALDAVGWKPMELTALIVGLGPGSYTGLRVALATSKALCHATGCEFFGVDSFSATLHRVADSASNVAVVGDALQNAFYLRTYQRVGGVFEPTRPFAIASRSEIEAIRDSGTTIVGPAAAMVGGETIVPDLDGLLISARNYPWAVERDVWIAEPHYLRGSSAEEKRKANAEFASSNLR
jgi:tRNA threonylcarbamoyladenosine biosynthesis protein TsaB